MTKHFDAYKEAAAELASQVRSSQFRDTVELQDARESVDADVIVAWIAHQTLDREDETLLGDTLIQRLTSAQARTLMCAVAIDHADKVLELVKGAIVEQIARDLQYDAQKLVDQYDPSDAEIYSDEFSKARAYANQVDDPCIGDGRALARSYR